MRGAESGVSRVGEVGTAKYDEKSCEASVRVRAREKLMIEAENAPDFSWCSGHSRFVNRPWT